MARFFGVRHFSPACAGFVTQFLEQVQPQLVLIEGPSDLSSMIPALCDIQASLPAAILAYTQEDPIRTVLWPFAEFSPEYQAMLWAQEHQVPVRFCDLPSDCVLALQEQRNAQERDEQNQQPVPSVYQRLQEASGLDQETFWEYGFEHNSDYTDFLAAVEQYGNGIREFSVSEDDYNVLREAYMARCIDEAVQSGIPDSKIAVITGAFHVAGLKALRGEAETQEGTAVQEEVSDQGKVVSATVNSVLEKLPTVESKATLMPYSYYRLSTHSGYGAGSKAPGYYEILWEHRNKGTLQEVAPEYLSRLAKYQRDHGFVVSSAEVIEALRLAETLAIMRSGKYAGMSDLRDAAVTCLGHGSFGEISLACADTEVGVKIGSLPEGTVCTSVQEDFMKQLKELKLERFRSAAAEQLELDLRENLRVKTEKSAFLDLNRSFFLHRLHLLGVHFAAPLRRQQENATWAELWQLQWTPEAEIEIVEISLKGDTVVQAAQHELGMRLSDAQSLSETAKALSDAFFCGLPETVKSAVSAVQGLAAGSLSAAETGNTLGTLSDIVRFGSIRRIDTAPLLPLMEQLFLRFCLGLPAEIVCDRAAAEEIITALAKVNDACLSHDFLEEERLLLLLSDLADSDFANPLLSGYACGVLIERGKLPSEKLSELMNRRLSKGTAPQDGAQWFEGLARKNRRSLISRLSVWEKLCQFISELDDEEFKPVLVCLRRTFTQFSPAEKSDIAENVGEALHLTKEAVAEFTMAEMTVEEKQILDELDDFDFGGI